MKIIICGASGLIGQALVNQLINNHEITVAGRNKNKLSSIFKPLKRVIAWKEITADLLKNYDVIINLTGENIGQKKWRKIQKEKILQSRISTTLKLAELCAELGENAPKLMNASAIGIYGFQPTLFLQQKRFYDEFSTLTNFGNSFLAEIACKWENALLPAEEKGVNVIKLRFGVVLSPHGGMLAKLMPLFKFGAGSIIGSGEQPISWVSIDDAVRAIEFLMQNKTAAGSYNIVAPEVVSQREFAICLAKIYNRPCFLRLPAFFIKLLFGQMGKELLLNGQTVIGQRLHEAGFKFSHPALSEYLELCKNKKTN